MERLLRLLISVTVSAWLPTAAPAADGTVTVDFNITTLMGSPYVFGGVKFPQEAQANDVFPKLANAGITSIRGDYYFEAIIPPSICANIEDYRKNVGDIQNPDHWKYGHLYWIDGAKASGLRTMICADYCPTWLSWNGNNNGVPKDWSIWEDIVRKVYERYHTNTDWIELWNEPDYGFLTVKGSPYRSKPDALADLMFHTTEAIRSVNPKASIGGFAFGWRDGDMFRKILARAIEKHGRGWVDRNFNFLSWHQYSLDCGATYTAGMRAVLSGLGLNPNKPIFIDEWNHRGWHPSVKEIGFAGRALTKFVKSGVNANYYSLYPYNYTLVNTIHEDGHKANFSFYTVDPGGKTGTLSVQSYPFRVLSNKLGLGKGVYAVKKISNQKVVDACAAVNSAGQKIVFIANYYDHANSATLTLKGLNGNRASAVEYLASGRNPGHLPVKTIAIPVKNGTGLFALNMAPETCVGLIINDGR